MSSLEQWLVGTSDGKLASSPDGSTFTEQTGFAAAFGGNHVNVGCHNRNLSSPLWNVGGAAGAMASSTDGATWTNRATALGFGSNAVQGIAYDNVGRWTAVGAGNQMATSTDGVTWAPVTSPFLSGASIVCVAHDFTGLWCAAANTSAGVQVASSSNGTSWSLVTLPSQTGTPTVNSFGHNHLSSGGLWNLIGNTPFEFTSPDGITWSNQVSGPPSPTPAFPFQAITSNESVSALIWATIGSGWAAAYSNDGIAWTNHDGSMGPGTGPETEYAIATDRSGVFLIVGSLGSGGAGGPSIYSWNPSGSDPGTVTPPGTWTSNVVTMVAYSVGATFQVPDPEPFTLTFLVPSTNPSVPPPLGFLLNFPTPIYNPPIPPFNDFAEATAGITSFEVGFNFSSAGNATSSVAITAAMFLSSQGNATSQATSSIVATQVFESAANATSAAIIGYLFTLTSDGVATGTPTVVYHLFEALSSLGIAKDMSTIGGVYGNALMSAAVAKGQVSFAYFEGLQSTGNATGMATVQAILSNELMSSGVGSTLLTAFNVVNFVFTDVIEATDLVSLQQILTSLFNDGAVLVSSLSLGADDYTCWILNTKTFAPVEYCNWPFNSFATPNDELLGCQSNGIYELGLEDDDDGTPIAASFRTGLDNLGSNAEKQVVEAFAGVATNGTLVMKVTITERQRNSEGPTSGKRVYWYKFDGRKGSAIRTDRVKFGRGLKSGWWQFEVCNQAGCDFDFDSIQLHPVFLERRVR